jgi:hypothetical protein
MMKFTQGNLLDAPSEALVNTVNTVGVMGKGIALMFKEAFPANFRAYEDACKQKEVKVGKMFVTENRTFSGPRWIINFPTKKHWRNRPSWSGSSKGWEIFASSSRNIRSVRLPYRRSELEMGGSIGARCDLRWNASLAPSKGWTSLSSNRPRNTRTSPSGPVWNS